MELSPLTPFLASVTIPAKLTKSLGPEGDAPGSLNKFLDVAGDNLDGNGQRIHDTLKELADAEAKSGALEEADEHYLRAIAIHKRNSPVNLDLADALTARAGVLEELDRSTHANLLRREVEALRKAAEDAPRLADHLTSPLAGR